MKFLSYLIFSGVQSFIVILPPESFSALPIYTCHRSRCLFSLSDYPCDKDRFDGIKGELFQVGGVGSVFISSPTHFVLKLASHPPNPVRALEDTAVGQSVAYANDTGEVTVGGYYPWDPAVAGMAVSRKVSWRSWIMKC